MFGLHVFSDLLSFKSKIHKKQKYMYLLVDKTLFYKIF